MIHVEPNWWKTLFDEVYLVTDAPFVCNADLTRHEVNVVENVLALCPADRILDLCGGQGRHAVELARRGYHNPTVLDYSEFLLRRGRREAAEAGLMVTFLEGDARATTLPDASFDVILLMANSFGYFIDPQDDCQVLRESARLLPSGGRFLLDLIDRDAALQHFRPESWHEATDDMVVCWQREQVDEVIRVREMVLSKTTGLVRDRTYAERLYTPEQLSRLLLDHGFGDIRILPKAFVHTPEEGKDYGLATNRMLVIAIRQ